MPFPEKRRHIGSFHPWWGQQEEEDSAIDSLEKSAKLLLHGGGMTFGTLRSPSRRARLHLPLFPMGLHWVHGCRPVLEAGAKERELRTSLRWAEPSEGLGQGRRVSRNLSEALRAFAKCKAGPQWMGPTGELRNVPLWLSRFSIRTRQKAFRRWS